jgi:hypothetical protein
MNSLRFGIVSSFSGGLPALDLADSKQQVEPAPVLEFRAL